MATLIHSLYFVYVIRYGIVAVFGALINVYNIICRYVAIVRPLHRRNSRKKAMIFILIIWILSGILSAPCLMYSMTESKL